MMAKIGISLMWSTGTRADRTGFALRCTSCAERNAMSRIGTYTLVALALTVAVGSGEDKAAGPGYEVKDKFALGGEGGWDYLNFDGASHRLYIARSNRVMVVDAEKGKLVG